MDQHDNVTPASDGEPVLEPTAPEPVSSADQATDRPVQNLVGEMNRKFGKLQDQVATLMQMVGQQQAAASPQGKTATDEELWALAQQGDRTAFELYQERIADRRVTQRLSEAQQSNAVSGQINLLVQRYPVIADPSHPLNQTYQQIYQALTQNGYPASRATQLDAMKTAIADRPDLVVAMHQAASRAGESSRVSATTRARAGQTGVASQNAPRSGAAAPAINRDQQALAQRMGVKDPAKAIERFRARQESGQSQLGQVGNLLPEDSL